MGRKKSGETESRWREIVKRQARSGRSVRSFCAAEGISEPSFYAWRKRLRTRREPRRDEASNNAGLFVPLKLLDTAATLEIVHPLGYRIQVTGDVNPVALRQVIEVLEARGAR
jgi:hypothetical protein